jgi:predicted outer membrane repeat protein
LYQETLKNQRMKETYMKKSLIVWLVLFTLLETLLPDSLAKAANAVVGNGTAGSCTEAAFNSALTTVQSSGGGTITFNCGAAQKTITFTVQKVVNLTNVTINGNNLITLNGSLGVRHFFVGNGVTLTLQNITLRMGDPLAGGGAIEINESDVVLSSVQISNNYASTIGGALYCYGGTSQVTITNSLLENNSAATSGGAIYNDGCEITIDNSSLIGNTVSANGGAIFNAQLGNLTVNDSLFQNNEALDGAGMYNEANGIVTLNRVEFLLNHGGYGGGVENGGTITVNDSLFDTNTVTGSGGGFWNLFGTATINRTTFNNNSAAEGGGVNSYGNHIEVNQANITNNTASGSGGGIYHGGGTAFFSNLTISGNQADLGGGIHQHSDDNLTLTNATVANNTADSYGGGFYHYNRYAILTNVTLANNTAGTAGNAIQEDSPMSVGEPGVVQIVNSVILGSANNCGGGIFTSFGYNLSQGTCASLSESTDQEDFSGALNLGSLTSNGGSYAMLTMKPAAGSPLIDAGDNTVCPAADQIDMIRPQDGDGNGSFNCDIGAIEVPATISATYKSIPANDGWILESSETSNTGGTMNSAATTITLGDDAADKQYRAILHFDTSALPDTAVVTNMTLKIKQQGNVTGVSPFTFGSLYVDMRNPAFGGSSLELTDFNFAAKKVKPAVFNPNPVSGWYSARFNNGGKLYINRTGVSQLRLYFSVDDNNNNVADFIRFYSGNAAAGDRPKLLITYYVP